MGLKLFCGRCAITQELLTGLKCWKQVHNQFLKLLILQVFRLISVTHLQVVARQKVEKGACCKRGTLANSSLEMNADFSQGFAASSV